ncbi:kinase-like domain-containing protein [Tuber borchii]|uniref:Kinase-like domain-containing protein n=1 Tax=Tuber borchii TaxID=42251 RepID=A0A2T6ZU76_TUBBO|nr:kinase-like domain-containing protein [Tuber borchii]
MDRVQSDLVEWYKLETEFFHDHVRHTRYVEKARNRNEKVKEDWRNCEELGRGGFGIVHKQIEKATGDYRAVKAIDKRQPLSVDYPRELLVMAKLAKRPSLFVEFLGWFEGPEILYIVMEFLEEGDLTKHIGAPLPRETVRNISEQILEGLEVMHQQGIAHRDIKLANIFVVSMSLVWVKLGDFGVSNSPEVRGLDPNSETSEYTNSVNVWSLGCVIYELLAGTKLFVSEFQLSGYFYGKWPFPADRLRGLSPPTGDIGISLLKAMLAIQPQDRPTAADALNHAWLADLKSDNEHSGDDGVETIQSGYRREKPSRKRENTLSTTDRPKKKRSERNQISQADTRRTPGGLDLGAGAGFQSGGGPATRGTIIDTPVMVLLPSDAASTLNPEVETGPQKLELVPGSFQATNSKAPKALKRNKGILNPQTCPQNFAQTIPQRQTLTVEMVFTPGGRPKGQLNTHERERIKPGPTPPTRLFQEFPTSEHTLTDSAGPDNTIRKIQRTKPNTRGGGAGRSQHHTTANSMKNQNSRRHSTAGQDPDYGQTPHTRWNPSGDPDARPNPNLNPDT